MDRRGRSLDAHRRLSVGRGLTIGRVRGIPIVIDLSWVVIALVVTWAIYSELVSTQRSEPAVTLWVIALAGATAFFGSVLSHELSHSLVAERRGLRVRRIRLFIFGGVSEIEQEAATAQDELALTIAGPASSIALGAVLLAVSYVVPSPDAVERTVRLLAVVNVMLGVFNLLPGFPLDGGRILRALIWRSTGDFDRATDIAVRWGQSMAVALIAIGSVVLVSGELAGLWYAAIGWFLFSAATDARARARFQQRIRGLTVGEVMSSTPRIVSADLTLEAFRAGYLAGERGIIFPVLAEGRVRGLVGAGELRRVRRSDWADVTVGRVMRPVAPHDVVADSEPVDATLDRLSEPGRRVLVVNKGRLAGMLGPRDLQRILRRSDAKSD